MPSLMKPASNNNDQEKSSVRLFISHSSRDAEIVKALVDLLRAALNLPAREIRCTSIDGYRLPGGAKTEEQLRAEVNIADAFVGVVSASSLQSLYVAFELGARWGAGKHLLPLLLPGISVEMLSGPLSGINALRAENGSQLHQLVTDLAKELGITPEGAAVYQHHIDKIVTLSTAIAEKAQRSNPTPQAVTSGSTSQSPTRERLGDLQTKILTAVGNSEENGLTLDALCGLFDMKDAKMSYYLDTLQEIKLLDRVESWEGEIWYELTSRGRKFLVENKLI